MITADVELADLLTHLVEEARALVGARYAALGVLNETRTGLEQFITVGLGEAEEEVIGQPPPVDFEPGRSTEGPVETSLRSKSA